MDIGNSKASKEEEKKKRKKKGQNLSNFDMTFQHYNFQRLSMSNSPVNT